MDSFTFADSPCGRVVRTRTGYNAFVPDHLPRDLSWTGAVAASLERAALALGELSFALSLRAGPHASLLLARDAVAAARSEGRPITVSAFYRTMAVGGSDPGVRLAANYMAAVEHGRRRMTELPLSLRLLRELHLVLANGVVDFRATPGEFRISQNWLGIPGCSLVDATYVPPPVAEMRDLLDDWERFLHQGDGLPALARLSLAQLQFLMVHPFLEMNILASAVLASVILLHLGMTEVSIPVFGRWLERSAAMLPARMLDVCARGCREEWLSWYLHGLADVATETLETERQLLALSETRLARVTGAGWDDSARTVAGLQFRQPAITVEQATRDSELPEHEAVAALRRLESAGLAACYSSGGVDVYVAEDIVATLESATPDRGYRLPF